MIKIVSLVLTFLVVAVLAATKTVTWTFNPSQKKTVNKNDVVVFKWTNAGDPHDVYEFPSKSAFDACNFAAATKKCGTSVNQCSIKMSVVKTRYFGCSVSGHCKSSGMKIAIKAI